MASIRCPLRTRVADNELDSRTRHHSSGQRLSIDFTRQASEIDGPATPYRFSTPASRIPYAYNQQDGIAPRPSCSPASALPFSIYNFMAPQSKDARKSPSSTKAVGDTSELRVAATTAAVPGTSASPTPHASLASRRDGQPLPKPSQPPKPAPGPKPQKRDQGEDLLHCADCSLAPPDDAYTNELQQQEQTKQEVPTPVYFDAYDSEWERAGSPESDPGSNSPCCTVCSCYSGYSSSEGSMTIVSETATLASQDGEGEAQGEGGQAAVNSQAHSGSGDGQANANDDMDDDDDDAGSSHSASSEGWVDLAEPSQHHNRLRHQSEWSEQDSWPPSRGPTSHSRDSPPPPPPPPPSSPRRRQHGDDAEQAMRSVAGVRRRAMST